MDVGTAVTYLGPTDDLDPSNEYEVPAVGDRARATFRKGVRVDDVPAAVVDVLKSDAAKGHGFDFGDGAKRLKADVQAEATELGVEFTDRTTVDELEDLIAAKRAEDGS